MTTLGGGPMGYMSPFVGDKFRLQIVLDSFTQWVMFGREALRALFGVVPSTTAQRIWSRPTGIGVIAVTAVASLASVSSRIFDYEYIYKF